MNNPGTYENERRLISMLQNFQSINNQVQDNSIYQELIKAHDLLYDMIDIFRACNIKESPHQKQYLQEFYNSYPGEKRSLFTIEDLYHDGWLTQSLGEWNFSVGMYSEYGEITNFENDKEEQILCFLKNLSDAVCSFGSQVQLEQINSQTLLEKGLLYKNEENTYDIDYGNKFLRKYGTMALSIWWDQIIEQKTDEHKKWLFFWRKLRNWGCVEEFAEHKQELIDFALTELEKEKSLTWEAFLKCEQRKMYLETSIRNKCSGTYVSFPQNHFACAAYINAWRYQSGNIIKSYQIGISYAHLCVRNYDLLGMENRKRICDCFTIPYLYLELGESVRSEYLLVDCLKSPILYTQAFVAMIEKLQHFHSVRKEEALWLDLQKLICKNSFAILQNKLDWSIDTDKWQSVLNELSAYLNEHGFFYLKYQAKQSYTSYQHIYKYFLDWYPEHILLSKTIYQRHLSASWEDVKNEKNDILFAKRFAGYILIADLDAENNMENIFDAYQLYIKNAKTGKILSLTWDFWQKKVWLYLMEYLSGSREKLHVFLQLLTHEEYERLVSASNERTSVSTFEYIISLHLYLISLLLIEARHECSFTQQKQLSAAFTSIFLHMDIKSCDPLSPESIRLLGSDWLVQRYMETIPFLTPEDQSRILGKLKNEPADKLIFHLDYIKNQSIRIELKQTLAEKGQEEYTQDICFLPTWKKAIERMVNLCFDEEDEATKSALLKKLEHMISVFCQTLEKKGTDIQTEYEYWLDTINLQVLLIKGDEETILTMPDTKKTLFYKALVYLNKEDLASLKKAEEIYKQEIQKSAPAGTYINDLVSCVRIATHKEILLDERIQYLEKSYHIFQQLQKKSKTDFRIGIEENRVIFSNMLYLYWHTKRMDNFWHIKHSLPSELNYDFSCARYIILMYHDSGNQEEANRYLQELLLRYGNSKELLELQADLNSSSPQTSSPPQSTIQSEPSEKIEKLIASLNAIRSLSAYDKALVRLQRDDLEDPVETYLLHMILNASEKLNLYSDYMYREEKSACENAYSKFLQILFEQKNKDFFDFYMKDQTQEGTSVGTTATGKQSIGSLDMGVYHNDELISIIEAIRINHIESENLEKHVRKIAAYNYGGLQTVFLIIYADTDKPKQLWESYQNLLMKLKAKTEGNQWHISNIIPKAEIDLVKKNLQKEPLYLFATEHCCDDSAQHFKMYHILIDVKKAANKAEGRAVNT